VKTNGYDSLKFTNVNEGISASHHTVFQSDYGIVDVQYLKNIQIEGEDYKDIYDRMVSTFKFTN
jgi:hypothetical protein